MEQFEGYKKCPECECIFPIIMFYNNKSRTDGLTCCCIDCTKKRTKKYQDTHPQSESTKELKRISRRKYNKSLKGRISYKKYYNTIKGKENKVRTKSRRRNFGYTPLMDNPFPEDIEINWHHINNLLVIPIPTVTHRRCYSWNTDKHRELVDRKIELIYGINFTELFKKCMN